MPYKLIIFATLGYIKFLFASMGQSCFLQSLVQIDQAAQEEFENIEKTKQQKNFIDGNQRYTFGLTQGFRQLQFQKCELKSKLLYHSATQCHGCMRVCLSCGPSLVEMYSNKVQADLQIFTRRGLHMRAGAFGLQLNIWLIKA